MTDIYKIAACFLTIFLMGYLSLKIMFQSFKFDFKAFWLMYGLGCGFVSLEMFIMSLAGLRFSLILILVPWACAFLFILYKNRIGLKKLIYAHKICDIRNYKVTHSGFLKVSFFVALFLLPFMKVMEGIPLIGWDAWSNWGLKAKMFYMERGIPWFLYLDPNYSILHKEYPLLVSLIQAFFYNFLGRFDDSTVTIIFFFFYISLTVYFYNVVLALSGLRRAYLFTFFLATVPFVSEFGTGYYSGYADLIFTYFNFLSVTLIYFWINNGDKDLLILSSIFTGLALWTKVDGYLLYVANIASLIFLTYSGAKSKKVWLGTLFTYAAIPLVMVSAWYFTAGYSGFVFIPFRLSGLMDPYRYIALIKEYWRQVFTFSNWNIFWPFFIAIVLVDFKRILSTTVLRFFLLNVSLQFILYFCSLLMHNELYFICHCAVDRMLLPLMPLALILISGILWPYNQCSAIRDNCR